MRSVGFHGRAGSAPRRKNRNFLYKSRLVKLLRLVRGGLAWGNIRCRACAELVCEKNGMGGGFSPGPALCAPCAALLLPRRKGYCPSCGQIFSNAELAPYLCGDCLSLPPPWSAFYFFGVYENLLKTLFIAFKFNGDLAAGRLLAALLDIHLAPLLAKELPGGDAAPRPLLIPVPVHKGRLRERGFNQSLLLAKPLARRLKLELAPRALWRTRLDPPQSSLDRKERLRGPKGAFAADSSLLRGRSVILLDDIMTTGATLREAARVLLARGAADVRVVVLARTPSSA